MSRKPPAGRLVALFTGLVLGFAVVAGRLVVLQVRDANAYDALARDQRVRTITLSPTRGSIHDRNLHELALSLPARAVYADPRLVERPRKVAAALAPLLEISAWKLRRTLRADTSFVYLARRVDLERAERIERLGLPGVGLLEESKRYYPSGDLAAQVLGFVGIDDTGLAGMELQHDDILSGQPGSMVIEQDPSGHTIPQAEARVVDPVPGHDVVLTIDKDLQFQAERALRSAVKANGAKGGTVIMMDPRTGHILAMAGFPSFDANAYDRAAPEVTRNRAVTDVYEPGSVNKVITASAAVDEGAIGLSETLEVPDRHRLADKVFHDAHPHPPASMTLTDIIAQSSNVGTIMVAQRLGEDTLYRYLRRFGFGKSTGVGFPGEASGILLPPQEWWATSMGTIPIGQGIAVTPLQMLSVFATVANGGVRVRPTLLKGTIDQDGHISSAPAGGRHRVISARAARKVTGMLAQAVHSGTGQEAQIPGYWVAGKTGTARKPLEGARGYGNRYVASFMGIVPARRPRLAVAAILDEPATVYGGVAAAPLFREVVRFALAHLRIPPTERPGIPPVAAEKEG